ncbi:MAG: cobalt-precorrin-6A reductase [Phormidesmis sp.]
MAVDALAVDVLAVRLPHVWLIGGTRESVELAKALAARDLPYVVTVTTPSARALYHDSARVHVEQILPDALEGFVERYHVRCILDASHPFANQISQQAIALCQRYQGPGIGHVSANPSQSSIAYLRYERPRISSVSQDKVVEVASVEALMAGDLLSHQRVLFTIGYRHLQHFSPLRQTSKLFARVLPSVDAIAGALAAGFSPSEIVALRPPISLSLEKALWQQWQISWVVAKASGQPGGEAIKRQVAAELNIGLVLIRRPSVVYPKQTDDTSEAVNFCAEALTLY